MVGVAFHSPWDRVISDVRPFLDPGQGLDLLDREALLDLLG